jgi:uncharacterized protein
LIADRAAPPREALIDALRGMALCGIALPNLAYFTWPPSVGGGIFFALGETFMDRIALFAVTMLAMNKFYPIFAFLFGVGAGLMARRWQGDFVTRYRRRLVFLLCVGVLHGLLLWFGDILTLYAICGFVLLAYAAKPLRRVLRALRTWAGITLVLITVGTTVIAWQSWPDYGSTDAAEVARLVARSQVEAAQVHEVFASGDYWQVTLVRAEAYATIATSALAGLFTHVVTLFLAGIMAARLGWFRARPCNDARWRRIAKWGWGLGVPLNGVVAIAMLSLPQFSDALYGFLYFAGPLLAAGYVASFVLAWRRGPGWLALLAPAGRMAFTNYLMQSLVFALVLSGFGLGMAQHWDFAALLGFGLAFFFGVQVPLSRWWLERHPQGPLEAMWRRFTYG